MTADEALDQIVALWQEAIDYDAEADMLREEALNQQYLSTEAYAKAEALIGPLVEAHPEWRDDLNHDIDPRTKTDD
jgi:hypothetical protein